MNTGILKIQKDLQRAFQHIYQLEKRFDEEEDAGVTLHGNWRLEGNNVDATTFLGTINNFPLKFRANNIQVAKFDTINHNISLGEDAMANSTPLFNTVPNLAIGWKALRLATTGYGNYAIGIQSFENLTDGRGNIGLGHQTGVGATGIYNTLLGTHAGQNMTAGDYNVSLGYYAGFAIGGSYNTSLGTRANQTGDSYLTSVGYYARNGNGSTSTAGTYTTAVGYQALLTIGGDTACLALGDRTVISDGLTNAGAIGSQASCTQSNSISIGAIAGTNGAVSSTKIGIGITAPTEMLHVVGNIAVTGSTCALTMTAASTTTFPRLTLVNSTAATGAGANLVLQNDTAVKLQLFMTSSINSNSANAAIWYSPSATNNQFIYNASGSFIIQRTSLNPATTVSMKIFGNGNIVLGGGVTDNGYKFEVAGTSLFSSTVGIGGTPDASAILDVASTTKAIIIPRMTKTQRNAIASPIAGGVVYQTDNTPGFRVYNGTNWMRFTETAD